MSDPTQCFRGHPLASRLLTLSVRAGSTIYADRCNALATRLQEVDQDFSRAYPLDIEGKLNKESALKDYDWKDKLGAALDTLITCTIAMRWLPPAAVLSFIEDFGGDSADRRAKLVDSIEISPEEKKTVEAGGGDGGLSPTVASAGGGGHGGMPPSDAKTFSPTLAGALLSSHLQIMRIGSDVGRAKVAELGMSAADFASMDADDWGEAFPGPLFATRVQLKRYLRDQGLIADPSRSRESVAPIKSAASIKEDIRKAMLAGDYKLARHLKDGLGTAQRGSNPYVDLTATEGIKRAALGRARSALVAWGKRRDKAIADLKIDEYAKWKSSTEAAAAMSQEDATDEDFREFLRVEEQVRRDSTKQATLGGSSRLDAFREKLRGFFPSEPESKGQAQGTGARPTSFNLLPLPEADKAACSGTANVLTLYTLDDVNPKVEPAHELRKCAKDHARMYPHVRLPIPIGRADQRVTICEQKYRETTERLSESARARSDPPENEVYALLSESRTIISKSRCVLEVKENASIILGFLAMALVNCAMQGAKCFDHFFDRKKNQGIVSMVVLNRITAYAAHYVKYVEYRQQINHETQLSKAKYAAIHRQMLSQTADEVDQKGAPASEGPKSRSKPTAWTPSSCALKLKQHQLDKVGPTMDLVRRMRGYYEALGAMRSGAPGCPHCGLSHDHTKSVCHFHKLPAFRSKAFKEGYRLAMKAGYVTANEVDEWNSRKGREDADRCDKDGYHVLYRTQQHLRKGVPGGPM